MKKNPCIGLLQTVNIVICLLSFLAIIASLVGVYRTHFVGGGATFGTTTASLSLLAFAGTTMLFSKSLRNCCEK